MEKTYESLLITISTKLWKTMKKKKQTLTNKTPYLCLLPQLQLILLSEYTPDNFLVNSRALFAKTAERNVHQPNVGITYGQARWPIY